jgi:hypothetical protein
VELEPTLVRIRRKGVMSFLTQGIKGDKEIFISSITSVQVKEPSYFMNGYIQFGFMGGHESKRGIFDATNDENTVMFNQGQARDFTRLRSNLDRLRQELARPNAPAPTSSPLDELEKLASLRQKGIITDEEFAAKKKQLLGL